METIIGCLITGLLSLFGVIITNLSSNNKMSSEIKTSQAVTDTKIEELTREVREHNNFAQKIPTIENDIAELKKRVEKIEDKI